MSDFEKIACEMLDVEDFTEIPTQTYAALQRIQDLVEKVGGRLRSRQTIALAIALTERVTTCPATGAQPKEKR
jgi:hypothetical protein